MLNKISTNIWGQFFFHLPMWASVFFVVVVNFLQNVFSSTESNSYPCVFVLFCFAFPLTTKETQNDNNLSRDLLAG